MKDVLKTMGKVTEGKIKHSLIGFSTHTGAGLKFRNGLIYDVSPPSEKSTTINTIQPSIQRSTSPIPRSPSTNKEKETLPKLISPMPRFQRTPLKFSQLLKDSDDINDINIKSISG